MTTAPVCYLRLHIEDIGGQNAWGVAADLLPPGWFDKRPERTAQHDYSDLLLAAELARTAYLDHPAATPFELWRATHDYIIAAGEQHSLARLTANWGAALYERALIDAAARLLGRPAWHIIYDNLLGIDLPSMHPDLHTITLAEALPPQPLNSVWVRHTVGIGDPITEADLLPNERLDDGLPQALEEVVRRYGVSYFKIKISGNVDADLERLQHIAGVLDALPQFYVTLDGNEQYRSWDEVARLVEGLQAQPALRRLTAGLLFIEQPLDRQHALAVAGEPARAFVAAWRPLCIDESDATLDAWPRAAECGYRGVSFKGCKGFYLGLRNQALALAWKRMGRGSFFVSGEDLTAPPLVPLHQYLLLGAVLGIEHQERNGHHFTRGLGLLTSPEQRYALTQHPDLYTLEQGIAQLKIGGGRLQIDSLLRQPGLGLAQEPPWNLLVPAAEWTYESLESDH